MKQFIAVMFAVGLAAVPMTLPAQEAEPEDEGGFSLMEEGAQLFFRGLRQQMEPALDELEGLTRDLGPQMRELMSEMGPALADLMSQIDDLTNYGPPEILPNGDILIPRKPEAPELNLDGIEI